MTWSFYSYKWCDTGGTWHWGYPSHYDSCVKIEGCDAYGNWTDCTPTTVTNPDGIVEGTDGGDLIDVNYDGDPNGDKVDNNDALLAGEVGDDDIIYGYGGDDTIIAGNGDDEVYGGTGNDTIYGDNAGGAPATDMVRESLEWDLAGVGNNQHMGNFTQNTGSVDVTFTTLTQDSGVTTEYSSDRQNVSDITDDGAGTDAYSSMSSILNGKDNEADYQLEFSDPVENVSFRINDIDGDGIVRVTAYDANGDPIEVNLDGGAYLTMSDTDGVAGDDTADSMGGYEYDTSSNYSVLVNIPGPVSRLVIEHDQDGGNNSGINVTDVFFDVPVAGADSFDDEIEGGAGDDIIYGEKGDDTLTGNAGNDEVYGGEGNDLIDGVDGAGAGGNLISNGSFEDTTGLTNTSYGYVGTGAVPDWTSDDPNHKIDIHNDDREGIEPTDGDNWLDLEASPGNIKVGQDVAGVSDGEDYTLEFDAGDLNGGENGVNVYWGGELVDTIDPNDGTMTHYSYTVEGGAGDGSNRLEFEGTGNGTDYMGVSIDSVSLVSVNDASGNDLLVGGDDRDTILADAGDVVDGGAGGDDYDVLDLTGQGPFRLENVTPDSNGNGIDGTVVFLDSNGDPIPGKTIEFTEIEEVIGDEVQPDGTVEGTDGADLIDINYDGDPNGDFIDANDALLPGAEPQDDLVYAYGGDDTVLSGEGSDEVYGGEGNDTIVSGNGVDQLPDVGYPGVYPADTDPNDDIDSVYGGAGNDDISTGDDADYIDGGIGDDTIDAGVDDDVVDAGDGNDTVIGSEGNDIINGEGGDDLLFGGLDLSVPDVVNVPDDGSGPFGPDAVTDNNIDTIYGGAGDDTIYGMDDADVLYGGEDNDTVYGGIDDDSLAGNQGNDTLYGGQGNDELDGNLDDDEIYGGIGNDDIRGGSGDDTLFGDDGDDHIQGGHGEDTLYGGKGNDTLNAGFDADVMYGGEGDDTIFGHDDSDVISGDEGADLQYGGFSSDTFLGGNGGDVVVGGEDADDSDVDVLDLTGSDVKKVHYTPGDAESGIVEFNDGSTMTFKEIENVIPCFTPGTTIATPKGERLVEELQVGDRIITRDNGIQEIAWVGHKEMSGKQLVANPHLRPILIKAGSLGNGLPERDMMVSPNHRVLVASEKTQLYFEESEVLAAAKHMVGTDGIHAIDVMSTTYVHFMFERHEVVLSNGAWTESFQPGDYSLKGIGNSQRNEIFDLFPELATTTGLEGYQAARKTLKKHEARLLMK